MRALSLQDPLCARVLNTSGAVEDLLVMRADWGCMGSYGGIPGLAMESAAGLLPPAQGAAATAAAPPCHLADGTAPKTQPAPASVEPPPPPLFVEPTATASAAVVSAQRLNSDTTQTSAASPLLPDGTERGRTPPLPQPPQPPMQPLQPPTPMQLPPPGLPPSAAAAPPLPEAPRVLSAKALGKRKIGSW